MGNVILQLSGDILPYEDSRRQRVVNVARLIVSDRLELQARTDQLLVRSQSGQILGGYDLNRSSRRRGQLVRAGFDLALVVEEEGRRIGTWIR